MPEIKIHSKKEFLNLPFFESDASIASTIILNSARYSSESSVSIRDCSEKITLYFHLEDGYRENAMNKLDTMIAHLQEFRDALSHAYDLFEIERAKEELNKKDSNSGNLILT